MILYELYSVDFQGISGRITFNSSNGSINCQTNLYQIANGSEVFATATNGFQHGSYDTILDIVRVVGLPHTHLVGFFVILQCLEFIVIATLHMFTVVYSKSKSVKASSPQLSHFVFSDLYLLIGATILISVAEIYMKMIAISINQLLDRLFICYQ